MKSLLLLLALVFISANTHARKPAVEDFVGVEPESYKVTPPGTEVLFNFNQNVQTLEQPVIETQSPWFSFGVTFLFVTFPLLMWWGLNRKGNQPGPIIVAQPQSTENVHNLEDYRKPEEEDKKAS